MVEYTTPMMRDFIERTLKNLKLIETAKIEGCENAFETTQMLNSLAGLLIYPSDDLIDRIPQIELSKFGKKTELPKEIYGKLPFENTRCLTRYLRNAFAHFNTEIENESGEIKGLYVWSHPPCKEVDWVAYISVESLRELSCEIAGLFLKTIDSDANRHSPLEKIENRLGKNLRLTSHEARQ